MRLWIAVGLVIATLGSACASRGAAFWECFGELNTGGVQCGRACNECKRQTGSAVICNSVCGMRTIPAGSHTGVVIH